MTPSIPLTALELLTTTRSVRRRLDLNRPVPRELVTECLQIATQAPTGSNLQGWEFLVIDDPERKAILARFYRQAHSQYKPLRPRFATENGAARVKESVDSLAEYLHQVPLLVLPMQRGRMPLDATTHQLAGFYGSIFPATWSFMLAARLYGIGTSFTTMHLRYEREVAMELGIPYDRVTQAGLIAAGYSIGDSFSPARRRPVTEVTHWNSW